MPTSMFMSHAAGTPTQREDPCFAEKPGCWPTGTFESTVPVMFKKKQYREAQCFA